MRKRKPSVVIVGAGPAGLFAAERLAAAGAKVTVCDRMASPARKFLLAGRGGLNLTHSEPRDAFLARYGEASAWLAPVLDRFPPPALRVWADGLGEETFVGSSGRVFPKAFKASPLLRAWLGRLTALGVNFHMRYRLVGIAAKSLAFDTPEGRLRLPFDASLLALGGASWPRMGSDGTWSVLLDALGLSIEPLRAANMGVTIGWSPDFAARFAGMPLKRITLSCAGATAQGEAIITRGGLEGGGVYATAAKVRDRIAATGSATLLLDLKPDLTVTAVAARLASARPKDSRSSVLRKKIGLTPQAIGLIREASVPLPVDPQGLAAFIKAVPLGVAGVRPLERAISTAGGLRRAELGDDLQLLKRPGLFVAGEMLDWEAPTGGYLLQATFATAETAARGIAEALGLTLPPLPVEPW